MSNSFPISPYKNLCDGYTGSGEENTRYILGVTLGIGISNADLGHPGSRILEEINAFDLAEVDGPYVGQLNMSVVSSFCGPQGIIWGYDIANNLVNRAQYDELGIDIVQFKGKSIKVYNGEFLISALEMLFGNVETRRFNIIPGAHVPFASKNIKVDKPSIIYSAIGIGIPDDRNKDACLLMEDIGVLQNCEDKDEKAKIVSNLAESIIQIGINQKVNFKECLIIVKCKEVKKGETGCALVAAPYFTLAQNAVPKNLLGDLKFEKLYKMSLADWGDYIKKSS